MSRGSSKAILLAAWIAIVFGYLYFLQKVYDMEPTYVHFVLLAISGNLAYDGLKAVFKYEPLYRSDGKRVVWYVVGFIASLAAAVASLFLAAELVVFGLIGNVFGQVLGGLLFLASIVAGIQLIASAERHFKLSNQA